MVQVKLNLPVDFTFLSELTYMGILYSILKSECKFDNREVNFKDNMFLSKIYAKLDDEETNKITLGMVGNDNLHRNIFQRLNLSNVSCRKTYRDLMLLLKSYNEKLVSKNIIEVKLNKKRNLLLIDIMNKNEGVQAALFKIDRYTGISSLENDWTTEQITLYMSKEVALILLLGIYSSFITTIRHKNQRIYYFLFFSPEEIMRLLTERNRILIEKYFKIKDETKKVLRTIIRGNQPNELILTEIFLNTSIQNLMIRENIDKISLALFKVGHEGQTYKIYEKIPITLYSKSVFYRLASKYFREPEELANKLSIVLSPNHIILKNISNLKADENSNLVRAILGLYRFVVLGDMQGWFTFLRELWNAHEKRKNAKGQSEYLDLIRLLSYG